MSQCPFSYCGGNVHAVGKDHIDAHFEISSDLLRRICIMEVFVPLCSPGACIGIKRYDRMKLENCSGGAHDYDGCLNPAFDKTVTV